MDSVPIQPKDIVSILIAGLAFTISLATAYKTLFARFRGKAWASNRLVLTRIGETPSIGLACFFENVGARAGMLDDLRLEVKHDETNTIFYFYPQMMRDDYSIYKAYTEADWFPFSGISLPARQRSERYLLFKPLNDQFAAKSGHYQVALQTRWEGKRTAAWDPGLPQVYTLDEEIAKRWADKIGPTLQVASEQLLGHRRI